MHTDRTERALLALALAASLAAAASARPAPEPEAPCEGEACAAVTLAFDEAKQQYLVHNNSSERWARVSASNLAASASACLRPGRDEYLPLKSIVGPYRAAYAEQGCPADGGGE